MFFGWQCSRNLSTHVGLGDQHNTYSVYCLLLAIHWNVTFSQCNPETGFSPNIVSSHKSVPLADLGGREGRTPPWASKFFRFHAVFRENLACSRPPWRVHAPPSGKSWIRHCVQRKEVKLHVLVL